MSDVPIAAGTPATASRGRVPERFVEMTMDAMESMPDVTVCACECHERSDANLMHWARTLQQAHDAAIEEAAKLADLEQARGPYAGLGDRIRALRGGGE